MFVSHADKLERLAARVALISSYTVREQHIIPTFAFSLSKEGPWQEIPHYSYWGEWYQDFFLKGQYQIPESWPLDATIALHLPIGDSGDGFSVHPEALITIDGRPFTAVDIRHQLLVLDDGFKDHQAHELLFDGWTGLGGSLNGDHRQRLYMQPCALVMLDEPTRHFVALARTTQQAAAHLPEGDQVAVRLIEALSSALITVDTRHPIGDSFYASIPRALDQLQNALEAIDAPHNLTIHAVGHAHIDTAWLWTISQTRRKAARSFSTVMHLMDLFPDYHFSQSQPQLYEFIRQDHPELFEWIRAAVAAGRWEPMGGMWVESDCNIAGAESLARQFLMGRRYIHEHFGAEQESRILWLPDTFGYPATLPQIAREAGIDYFFTTKLRWNEQNDFPYDSFWWEGLDGTRLLAHITPTPMHGWLRMATYNAEANAQSIIETWERMKMKPLQDLALMSYGWGDGGGGPDRPMLENLEVLRDFPGLPRTQQGKARDFFAALEAESGERLPVWHGELYLETHQGTLTSQAWIKRANRKAEVLLHDTEYLAAWATKANPDYGYPLDALRDAWRTLLLHQFHDILPGSSIAQVYADARPEYERLMREVSALKDDAAQVLFDQADGDWTIINTTSIDRPAIFLLPDVSEAPASIRSGDQVGLQQMTDEGLLASLPVWVPPFGTISVEASAIPGPDVENMLVARPDRLENLHIRARFDEAGNLIELLHKDSLWSMLAPGEVGNQFQIFEDRPLRFDAWNIDPDFEDRMWLAEPASTVEVIEAGPVRATLKIVRHIMHSTITQHISLYHNSDSLDFHTHVDWQERQMMLKVAFPVNIRAADASYHIQWGHVQRPTHRSTSWDSAKWEVAAHHWADLGEAQRGVVLANDCKYAYDIRENRMRLTLLKSATYPDPNADHGEHVFTYRVQPRWGDLLAAYASGYDLNLPLLVHKTAQKSSAPVDPLIDFTSDVIIETVKRSEDGRAIILRLHEALGRTEFAPIHFGFTPGRIWRSNIMEEPLEELNTEADGSLVLALKPHQLMTLRVELEPLA